MRFKILGASVGLSQLFLIGLVIADTLLITGLVYGSLLAIRTTDIGLCKINQVVSVPIMRADTEITENFTLNTTTYNSDKITATLSFPLGSNVTSYPLNLNGNNLISPPIKQGNITINILCNQMGRFNISMSILNSTEALNITFVNNL